MNPKTTLSHNQKRVSNTLTILFIVFEMVCFNTILSNFTKTNRLEPIILLVGFLAISILASPIQAGFSDYLGRKKSLIISLSTTFLSLVILLLTSSTVFPLFAVLATTAILKGLLGNTIPIAWAVIGDIDRKDERFFFAVSLAAYALGFLLFLLASLVLSNNTLIYILILVFVAQIYFCLRHFIDLNDFDENKDEGDREENSVEFKYEQEEHFIKHLVREPKLIFKDLKKRTLRFICSSFIFLEISLYVVLILYTDFPGLNSSVAILMMCGYLLGCALMKLCKKYSNKTMMTLGFILSTFPLVIYIAFYFLIKDILIYMVYTY